MKRLLFARHLVRVGMHSVPTLLLILALALGGATPASATVTFADAYLLGPGGLGGTTSIPHGASTNVYIGSPNGQNQYLAQSFEVPSGVLTQFSVVFNNNTGTLVGTATWELRNDDAGVPGSVLATGTWTPTPSSTNVITVANGPFLYLSTRYWLVFYSTVTQTGIVYWNVKANTADAYDSGHEAESRTAGVNWSVYTDYDVWLSVTTTLGQVEQSQLNDKLAQAFTVANTATLSGIKLNLRKWNSPTGTDTLRLESDLGNSPSGALIDPNATATINEANLTTSYALTSFAFAADVSVTKDTKIWLVLSTNRAESTNYIGWATADFCAGTDTVLKAHTQGVWAPLEQSAIWEPVIVSVTAAATEEPNLSSYITLPISGGTARLQNELDIGGGVSVTLLFIMVGLLILLNFRVRRK